MHRLALLAVVAACGKDAVPPLGPDADIDAAPDAQLPAGCDYVELADATNDFTIAGGAPESTGLAFAQSATVCGRIDRNHFDGAAGSVDVDGYIIAVDAGASVIVTFTGAGAEALASVDLELLDATDHVIDSGRFLGNHAVFATTLIPGSYRLAVAAKNTGDIAAAIDYKLTLAVDDPEARCAKLTAPAAYTESTDGGQSNKNDVVEIRYTPSSRALTAANDAPEPTGITTAAGTPVRITGTSGDVDAADDFKDRDAYLVTTGAHDELTVRVDWTGDADFDVFVFPEDSTTEIARATTVGKTAPERATFPVLPNTRYWLWIGSYDTSAGLPVTYDATLCPK